MRGRAWLGEKCILLPLKKGAVCLGVTFKNLLDNRRAFTQCRDHPLIHLTYLRLSNPVPYQRLLMLIPHVAAGRWCERRQTIWREEQGWSKLCLRQPLPSPLTTKLLLHKSFRGRSFGQVGVGRMPHPFAITRVAQKAANE